MFGDQLCEIVSVDGSKPMRGPEWQKENRESGDEATECGNQRTVVTKHQIGLNERDVGVARSECASKLGVRRRLRVEFAVPYADDSVDVVVGGGACEVVGSVQFEVGGTALTQCSRVTAGRLGEPPAEEDQRVAISESTPGREAGEEVAGAALDGIRRGSRVSVVRGRARGCLLERRPAFGGLEKANAERICEVASERFGEGATRWAESDVSWRGVGHPVNRHRSRNQ